MIEEGPAVSGIQSLALTSVLAHLLAALIINLVIAGCVIMPDDMESVA